MAWYVVFRGRKPGIYADWGTCNAQVSGFSGCNYQKYPTQQEAIAAFNSFFGIDDNPRIQHAPQQPLQAQGGTCLTCKDVVIRALVAANLLLSAIVMSQLGKEC
jgi:viroplasmin and RNaseH domain-containing protein